MGDRRSTIVLVLVAGCYRPAAPIGAPCEQTSDCPAGQVCVGNVCGGTVEPDAPLPIDAVDAPPPDAAPDTPPGTMMIVIGDDAAEVRDTEVNQAEPDTVLGEFDHVSVDTPETTLLWFDLTGISPTVTVLSATLTVTTDGGSADRNGGTVTIHRMREAWLENEATWNLRAAGQTWALSGARPPSRDAAPMTTFQPNSVNASFNADLATAMVQEWVAQPATNFGIAIARGTSTQHVHFWAKESGGNWPRLTLIVQP
jgi:hypothetical protein